MYTIDLKKNSREELIIYIEHISRDMMRLQGLNLELKKNIKCQKDYIKSLERIIENVYSDIQEYKDKNRERN